MEVIPRNQDPRSRFDAFCKAVLRNEARNYLRDLQRQRQRETSMDAVPQTELDKLSTLDHYLSESAVFSSHGYDLQIDNELVAEAFASLPATEHLGPALCAGPDRRGDRQPHGPAPLHRSAAADKGAKGAPH